MPERQSDQGRAERHRTRQNRQWRAKSEQLGAGCHQRGCPQARQAQERHQRSYRAGNARPGLGAQTEQVDRQRDEEREAQRALDGEPERGGRVDVR